MKEKLGAGADEKPCIFVFHGGSGSSEEDIATAVKVTVKSLTPPIRSNQIKSNATFLVSDSGRLLKSHSLFAPTNKITLWLVEQGVGVVLDTSGCLASFFFFAIARGCGRFARSLL